MKAHRTEKLVQFSILLLICCVTFSLSPLASLRLSFLNDIKNANACLST